MLLITRATISLQNKRPTKQSVYFFQTMKILSLFITTSTASFTTISHLASKIDQALARKPNSLFDDDGFTPSERTLLEPTREQGTNLNYLNGYGCWCNFDNYKLGHGLPVDSYDHACRRLHDNYLCIEEDYSTRDLKCIPQFIEYETEFLFTYVLDAVSVAMIPHQRHKLPEKISRFEAYCRQKNNGNMCAIEACISESHFLLEIYPDLIKMDFNGPDSFNHKVNQNFNFELDCNYRSGGDNFTRPQCCGQTPDRVRYHPDSKACCPNSKGGNVFDPILECCAGGKVEKIGQCA